MIALITAIALVVFCGFAIIRLASRGYQPPGPPNPPPRCRPRPGSKENP